MQSAAHGASMSHTGTALVACGGANGAAAECRYGVASEDPLASRSVKIGLHIFN